MKKLTVKQKGKIYMYGALFALLVIAAAVARVIKSGAKGVGEIAKGTLEEIKDVASFKTLLWLVAVIGSGMLLLFTGGSETAIVTAVALGVLTTGAAVVTTFNTTYVPKYFKYVAATQLTGVKITVQGDGVIFDSDAAGLNHVGVNRIFGQVTNGYLMRISNGFIKGKNVIWEFTNSAAQTPTIYVDSDETPAEGGQLYLQTLRQAVLANSGVDFSKFATLSLPAIGATDTVNVLYKDGTQQQMNRSDVQAALGLTQSVVNTPVYMLDNFGMRIKSCNVLAAAAQTAYIQRWVPVIGDTMISQSINN